MRLLRIWAVLVVLAGCQNGEPLPVASGPWKPLNGNYWSPSAAELSGLPK